MHREFRNEAAPCYQIEAWTADGRAYVSLVLTCEGAVREAAWEILQGAYLDRELIMRQGARVMRRRAAVG